MSTLKMIAIGAQALDSLNEWSLKVKRSVKEAVEEASDIASEGTEKVVDEATHLCHQAKEKIKSVDVDDLVKKNGARVALMLAGGLVAGLVVCQIRSLYKKNNRCG